MKAASTRLVVSAWVDLLGGEVVRGMPVLAQDGDNIGAVAGIVQKGASRSVTHLLLGQIPPTADYRLIPVGVLDRLEGECVYVRATRQQVAALSMYQADS